MAEPAVGLGENPSDSAVGKLGRLVNTSFKSGRGSGPGPGRRAATGPLCRPAGPGGRPGAWRLAPEPHGILVCVRVMVTAASDLNARRPGTGGT